MVPLLSGRCYLPVVVATGQVGPGVQEVAEEGQAVTRVAVQAEQDPMEAEEVEVEGPHM